MRSIILYIFLMFCALMLTPVLLVCALFNWPNPLFLLSKHAIAVGEIILGLKVQCQGLEYIHKNKRYIFMPNHVSMLDGPLVFRLIPQYVRVILKQGVFRLPVVGQAMKEAHFIPVDRKGKQGGKKAVQKAVRMIQKKDISFLIFPEGTRSRTGKLQKFKRGGFFMAIDSQTPVVPVSIIGTHDMMPKGSYFIKKGNIQIIFHPPVNVEAYNHDNMQELIEKVWDMVCQSTC
ncbi:MAG: 1-acyl-sn-glycerol-3-phosphate acyltransferase [Candidatus Aminicenantes bacterium]|nr:1-acyl-sn-glycerol-3-phosphate acyltransferase [Candidatus Aminicenantes bacterium]